MNVTAIGRKLSMGIAGAALIAGSLASCSVKDNTSGVKNRIERAKSTYPNDDYMTVSDRDNISAFAQGQSSLDMNVFFEFWNNPDAFSTVSYAVYTSNYDIITKAMEVPEGIDYNRLDSWECLENAATELLKKNLSDKELANARKYGKNLTRGEQIAYAQYLLDSIYYSREALKNMGSYAVRRRIQQYGDPYEYMRPKPSDTKY